MMKCKIACLLLALALSAAPARSQSPPPITIPAGAIAIQGSGAAPGSPVAASLAPVNQGLAYFCAFLVTVTGGTINLVTVSGLAGSSTMSQQFAPPIGLNQQQQVITPCIAAAATNAPITITATVDGTPTAISVNAWGYTQ